MTFTIKYNRSTSHIDGIDPKDSASGEFSYSLNACGALTRSRLATGQRTEDLAEAVRLATITGRKLCKTCQKAADAVLKSA